MAYILRFLHIYFQVSRIYIYYKSSFQNINLRATELHYFIILLPSSSDSIIEPFEAAAYYPGSGNSFQIYVWPFFLKEITHFVALNLQWNMLLR
jgi:hypothetical protein